MNFSYRFYFLALPLLICCLVNPVMAQEEITKNEFRSAIVGEDSEEIEKAVAQDKSLLSTSMSANNDSPLHFACQQGKLESVKTLLELGADVNQGNKRKWTPLHVAIMSRKKEIVEHLLRSNADVNIRDQNSVTPAMMAFNYGLDDATTLKVLGNKPDLTLKNKQGQTLFMKACIYGRAALAEKLMGDSDSVIQDKDSRGMTAFHYACQNRGMGNVAKNILAAGFDPLAAVSKDGLTPLHSACQSGNVEIIKILLPKYDNFEMPDKWGRTPLMSAVQSGRVPAVEMLLDNGADANYRSEKMQNMSLLFLAAQQGNGKMVEMLLKKKADPNLQQQQGMTPLHALATAQGSAVRMQPNQNRKYLTRYTEPMQALLDAGAKPDLKDKDGRTPIEIAMEADFFEAVELMASKAKDLKLESNGVSLLHWAAQRGLVNTAKIAGGQDVNGVDDEGRTPLMLAAQAGHGEFVGYMIKQRADVKKRDNYGETALFAAASAGDAESVKLLIDAGADVQGKDESGQSVLHRAAWSPSSVAPTPGQQVLRTGPAETVALILKSGVSPNVKTDSGYTPLHAAAWQNNGGCVGVLIKAGANANSPDGDGWTPLHKAAHRGHSSVVQVLVKLGADPELKTKAGLNALELAPDDQKDAIKKALKKVD